MIGDFINLWKTNEGDEIIEKCQIRLAIYKDQICSRGVYISNIPVKYRNGQTVVVTRSTNDIFRRFNNIEDANDYLRLTFEEFIEKYPKHEGKARFGNQFYYNGKYFTNS